LKPLENPQLLIEQHFYYASRVM